MRKIILVATALFLLGACSKKGGRAVPRTDADSMAYIIGMNVGENLLKLDSTLNLAALCEGIKDVFRAQTRLSQPEARAFYLRYVTYTASEKIRAYEEQFLIDIQKSNRSYARTPSGVTYTVESVGDEEQIPSSERDTVAIRYLIRTSDDQELYSSYQRRDTLRTALSELLPGVRESLKLIGEGGRIMAWLPAAEAYGATGNTALGVKPNATLYYEIELVDVSKYRYR